MRTPSGTFFGNLTAATLLVLAAMAEATEAVSPKGVVASQTLAASQAGVEMLRRGGNAFDAALAAGFVLAVDEPYHSGLGGGGFLVGYLADRKQAVALDFREVAPAAARRSMYLIDGRPSPARSRDGALAVAVPGAVAGYVAAERRWGKLGLPAVSAAAIKIADVGFPVTEQYRDVAARRLDCLASDPDAAAIFLARGKQGWEVPALGARVVQKDLARTMGAVAADSGRSFYRGAIANAVAKDLKRKGGVLTQEDLAAYAVRDREPLWGSYRGHRIATMPPPSGGGVTVLALLAAVEPLDLSSFRAPSEIHAFVEAARQVYADRATFFGDPAHVLGGLAPFTTAAYPALVRSRIDPNRATPSSRVRPIGPGDISVDAPPHEGDHTTHVSVIDAAGNAVALTTTVNYEFGSCVVAKGTGVLLNDEMDDFAQAPGEPNVYGLATSEANAIAPGKVPLSSMSPTLVFRKDRPDGVQIAIGSPGGPRIPTSVALTLVNYLDHRMPVDRAIAATRVHHQYLPDVLWVEAPGLEAQTVKALEAMGHTIKLSDIPWSQVQAVVVDPATGLRRGAADPRGEGAAIAE